MRPPGELPPATVDPSALLEQALLACQRAVASLEMQVVQQCAFDGDLVELVDFYAAAHDELRAQAPLAGNARPVRARSPGEATLSGAALELLTCQNNPLCRPDQSCNGMNAFAASSVGVVISPLVYSFAEGAAYWGLLVEDAGGDVGAVDDAELFAGLGRIYTAQSRGQRFTEVDEGTVTRLLEDGGFASEMFDGVMSFLIFHEIAHAELNHSLINHTLAQGVVSVLQAEGRMLSAQEQADIARELRNVKVFTETQADIYAATLLARAGVSSDAPRVLFTGAMAAFLVASGACSASMSDDELYDCAVQNDPNASHPPLDVRASVLARILDAGEDLSGLLSTFEP